MTTHVGIDPGVSGGIVALRPVEGRPLLVTGYKMPRDERGTLDLLRVLAPPGRQVFATLEVITPFHQGTGKASMAKLYGHYRALRMALTAIPIPFQEVGAARWHRVLAIPPREKREGRTEWKRRLRKFAEELFPDEIVTLAIADALLLAEYGRRCEEWYL
jgi:hypothetical protein